MELIVAGVGSFSSLGIAFKGGIPWKCKEDLQLFRQLTKNSTLVVGRKTAETLPELKDRKVYCVGSSVEGDKNGCVVGNLEEILSLVGGEKERKVFLAGGQSLYKHFLLQPEFLLKIHLSLIKENHPCDQFISISTDWVVETEEDRGTFIYYTLVYRPEEANYVKLVKELLSADVRKTRNSLTRSVFFRTLKFDLRKGFPLLTTKKMFFKGVVEEFLFFIRGETDSKVLEDKGVKIWKGNTERKFLDSVGMRDRREGLMGPLYGYQWRYFNAKYEEKTGKPIEKGVDQLQLCIDTIKNDPASRRIILTSFNPAQAAEGVLYPCHSLIIQFYVNGKTLSMSVYNRSQDILLGTPFNIASSALLLTLVAGLSGLEAGELHMALGDVHIYEEHIKPASEMFDRQPYTFPKLKIKEVSSLEEAEKLDYSDFKLENYRSHPAIKACMVA